MSTERQKSTILFVTLGEVCEDIRRFGQMVSDGFRQEAVVSTVSFDGMDSQMCLTEVPSLVQRLSPRLLVSAFAPSWRNDHSAAILSSVRNLPWHGPLFTLLADPSTASVAAVREAGADEVFSLPVNVSSLFPKIGRLLGKNEATETRTRPVPSPLSRLVGESPAFRSVIEKIPTIAGSDATVLITGETGTGKGMVAEAIHALSRRHNGPFVVIQCGALPERLVENELFGHAPGAYTDAGAAQKGLVEEAEGGTLFLDEIDALPLCTQTKLLSLIQEKYFRPLGSGKTLKADIRVIAASNADLESLVREGTFRRDLFYRLKVLPLHLPPLAKRAEDIPLLVSHFLEKHRANSHASRSLSSGAIALLQRQCWPGNVRELENLLERVLILTGGQCVNVEDLGLPEADKVSHAPALFAQAKRQAVAEFEREFIRNALASHQDNISEAARSVGLDRSSFIRLMRKQDLR